MLVALLFFVHEQKKKQAQTWTPFLSMDTMVQIPSCTLAPLLEM